MGIDEESLQRVVERYHETDELRVSDAFPDGGTDGGSARLGARLKRAAINQAENGGATPSRYGIWANTVRDHVLAAERMTRRGESECEILEHLRIAANSLSAFSDLQALLDREGLGSVYGDRTPEAEETVSVDRRESMVSGRPREAVGESQIPREPGMYIVTLKNADPISVNADDRRVAEKAIKVTQENCKVGKAKNLSVRARHYAKTFGEENVNFHPVAVTEAYQKVERLVRRELDGYRVRGPTGRKNEWLEGIAPEDALTVLRRALADSGECYRGLNPGLEGRRRGRGG